MTKYSTLLKAKLQELLSARGLPIDGTKEVLIERLEESDKIAAELDEEEEEEEDEGSKAAEKPKEEEQGEVKEPAKEETPEETKEQATGPLEPSQEQASGPPAPSADAKNDAEEAKELTPEQLKSAAVGLLNKKIARAQKFGEDQQVAALQADLNRIEKFGLALDSALARELGFAPAKPTAPPARKERSFKGHARGRGSSRGRGNRDQDHPRFRNGRNGHRDNRHSHNGRIYKTRY